jgi:endonuclease YncB( thermonuclease family)
MTSVEHGEESPTVGQDTAEAMVKYGITRVPTDYFYYKEYRYASLDDAIAQAKRRHPAVPSNGRERSGSR